MQPVRSRRQFIQTAAGSLGLLVRAAAQADPTRPTAAQIAWQDFEVGALVSLDLPVFAPEGWTETRNTLDPNLYRPSKYDTDQWIEQAVSMGCRYAVFTATHFNGFLQWQSDLYPYGMKQTAWRNGKADVFGDFVRSCHKYKIQPGVYLSCHRNAYQKVWNYRVNWGAGGEGQAAFARLGAKMTEELVSRYGPLCEIWFDAGIPAPTDGGPDVLPIVDRYQKHTVFYHSPQRREHRWIGNEAGHAGYPCWATLPDLAMADHAHRDARSPEARRLLEQGDPEGTLWSPGMVDVPIRNHEWFWRPGDDRKVYSPDSLVKMYYESVGRNCNLLIGTTPDAAGLIPEADCRCGAAFGKEIARRFARPLAETRGRGHSIELRLRKPERVTHVALMEEIAKGERIRQYTLEALTGAQQWTKIAEGESVGHKRIHQFSPVEVVAVRVEIGKSTAEPGIRALAVYG